MTETTVERRRPTNWSEQREAVSRLVIGRVVALQNQYCRTDPVPAARAALAQLRRGASTSDPVMASMSMDAFAVDVHTHVPDECYPLNADGNPIVLSDKASHAEIAVYTAMTLYAIHQQSRSEGQHRLGVRPGAALGTLAAAHSEAAVRRRFDMLLTAAALPELLHHLRTNVRLLRDASITLDYGQLTADLFTWQSVSGRERVRLSWSRDFENTVFRHRKSSTKDEQ